jgi:hypothetical protein
MEEIENTIELMFNDLNNLKDDVLKNSNDIFKADDAQILETTLYKAREFTKKFLLEIKIKKSFNELRLK